MFPERFTISWMLISEDIPLSKAVEKMAQEAGYSEPDPRVDLNGQDVIRKSVILAREAGYRAEQKDVRKYIYLFPSEHVSRFIGRFLEKYSEIGCRIRRKTEAAGFGRNTIPLRCRARKREN